MVSRWHWTRDPPPACCSCGAGRVNCASVAELVRPSCTQGDGQCAGLRVVNRSEGTVSLQVSRTVPHGQLRRTSTSTLTRTAQLQCMQHESTQNAARQYIDGIAAIQARVSTTIAIAAYSMSTSRRARRRLQLATLHTCVLLRALPAVVHKLHNMYRCMHVQILNI